MKRFILSVACSLSSLAFAACGGGSGGGGGGGGGFGPDTVAFLAPTNGSNMELFLSDALGDNLRKVSGSTLASAGVTEYAWSPDRTKLAFVADRITDSQFELFVVNAASPTPVRISHASPSVWADVHTISWSADGVYVAFLSDTADLGIDALYAVAAAGGPPVALSPTPVSGGRVLDYLWSPVGHRLAMRGDLSVDENFQLWVRDADGGAFSFVDVPGFGLGDTLAGAYRWSPNGNRLAYVRDNLGDAQKQLYSVASAGTGLVTHSTTAANRSATDFDWSPNSNFLAYLCDETTDTVLELYVNPVAGGASTRVGSAGAANAVTEFAWSPDSNTLAFLRLTGGQGSLYRVGRVGGAIFTMALAGPAGFGVTTDFAWAPDGSKLAFRNDHDGDFVTDLFTINPDGSGVLQVSKNIDPDGDVDEFVWSKDSSRLAYTADDLVDGALDLFVTSPASGGSVKVSSIPNQAGEVSEFGFTNDGTSVVFVARTAGMTADHVFVAPSAGVPADDVSAPLTLSGGCFGIQAK